uniref:Uncharacterized protein n=1 Tax=Octopus bimaculoides TaxID=37653 RepID=A0A0L8G568_OCTBM
MYIHLLLRYSSLFPIPSTPSLAPFGLSMQILYYAMLTIFSTLIVLHCGALLLSWPHPIKQPLPHFSPSYHNFHPPLPPPILLLLLLSLKKKFFSLLSPKLPPFFFLFFFCNKNTDT